MTVPYQRSLLPCLPERDIFRIVSVPVFPVETKILLCDIPYAQLGAILAINNDLRMHTTF